MRYMVLSTTRVAVNARTWKRRRFFNLGVVYWIRILKHQLHRWLGSCRQSDRDYPSTGVACNLDRESMPRHQRATCQAASKVRPSKTIK